MSWFYPIKLYENARGGTNVIILLLPNLSKLPWPEFFAIVLKLSVFSLYPGEK